MPGKDVMMTMFNPPHPGETLRELCLQPMGLSVKHAAEALGMPYHRLRRLLAGRGSITAEEAVRLSIAFDTSAQSWLTQQMQYDLWRAEQMRAQWVVTPLGSGKEREHDSL